MITRADIRRIVGNTTYMRGLDLYEQGHVLDMNIEQQGEYDTVIASVQGSGRKVYEVDISVNLETEEPDGFFCECPAFMSYDGVCKHCVCGGTAGISGWKG